IFDHCNLTNVRVFLKSIAYPYDNLNLDFTKNNFTLLYDIIRNLILSPSTFLSNAPIIVIDTSKQTDSAIASATDVQLEIEASESLTGVTAYCLLIHDRIVEYVPFTKSLFNNFALQYILLKIKNLVCTRCKGYMPRPLWVNQTIKSMRERYPTTRSNAT
ncbi:Uncharacterized protein FWK35_00036479, partial [Aphis craccivora]